MKKTKVYTKRNGYSESELLHWASDHLTSARILFKKNPICFDSAGYLSHLGIELVLKAILLNADSEFPNEHSLSKLSDLIRKSKAAFKYTKEHEDILKKLEGFYELRYPNPRTNPSIGDEDWPGIEALFEHLISVLPEDIQNGLEQRNRTEKGNRILMSKKRST